MILKLEILRVLSQFKTGTFSRKVADIMESDNFELIRTYLSQMVKDGYVTHDGKHKCSECAHPVTLYRITGKGRYKLSLHD